MSQNASINNLTHPGFRQWSADWEIPANGTCHPSGMHSRKCREIRMDTNILVIITVRVNAGFAM